MARAAVDRIPRERPRQQPVGGLHLRHHRISNRQRIVHAGHVRREIFREARLDEQPLARLLLGCVDGVVLLRKIGRLSRSARSQKYQRSAERRKQCHGPDHFDFPCRDFLAGAAAEALTGPRLFKYAMICQRDGSGMALQVGMPRRRLPFFNSQKYRRQWPAIGRARSASSDVCRVPARPFHGISRNDRRRVCLLRQSRPSGRLRDSLWSGSRAAHSSATNHPQPPCKAAARRGTTQLEVVPLAAPERSVCRRRPEILPALDFHSPWSRSLIFPPEDIPHCCTSKETEKRKSTLALLSFNPNCGERKIVGPCGMPKPTVGPRYCEVAFHPKPSVVPNPP